MGGQAVIADDAAAAASPFVTAIPTDHKFTFPQAIAHRGYKAKYPENTMASFKGAVDIGAHAVETDIHISKDGVLVLSHDPTLKRCYGREEKIVDCDWSFLSTLKTTKEPYQSMPRLRDLLEYLAQPGLEDIWVLLDIKVRTDLDDLMRIMAETIQGVKASPSRPWNRRIVLGCWVGQQIPPVMKYLPGFPVSHIGFSTIYANQFFKIPNVSFNMFFATLYAYTGRRFIKKCKENGRPVFAWTVNEEDKMRWSIKKQLDGVITDDPKRFLEVCEEYDESNPRANLSVRSFLQVLRIWVMLIVAVPFMTRRWKMDKISMRRDAERTEKASKPGES